MDRNGFLVRAIGCRSWAGILLGLLLAGQVAGLAQSPTNTGFRIVGYLPDYRVAGFDAAAASSLTDLIVFSTEPTPDGGLDLARLGQFPWPRLQEFKNQSKVRLLLAVGGWGRSRHFGKVSTSPELRRAFATATLKACDDLQLDGIDLDWEHPSNPAEEEGYGLLMEEMRRGMAPRGLVLSVTVAGWQKLTPLVIQSADLVQLMAYDQSGAHSTFEGAKADVEKLLKMGVPRAKLVLGVPFYGRHRTQRDRTPTYREIVDRYAPAPDVDEVDGVCFNGPVTIRRKAEYALGEGMAGAMIWEVGQDARGDASLLQILAKERVGARASARVEGRRITSQAFQVLSGQLMGAMAKGGPTNAIAFCSTRAIELTGGVGGSNRVVLSRVSHAPRNPANAANAVERDLIVRFEAEMKSGMSPASAVPAPVIRTNSSGNEVFYAPIVLSNPLCLQCHGKPDGEIAPGTMDAIRRAYPGDQATGFRVGDVRGLWRVEFGEGRRGAGR